MAKIRDFAFAADERYAMPMRVAIASLIWAMRFNVREARIHILDIGLGTDAWNECVRAWKALTDRIGNGMSEKVSFVRHIIDPNRFSGMKLWHGSAAAYARLLLPELLPECAWCLYSDSDVLFVEDPALLDDELDESVAMLGHKNPPGCDEIDSKWVREKGMDFPSESYLCSGMIAINITYFRENRLQEKSFEFLRAHPDAVTADQVTLNMLCAGKCKTLPHKWGMFNSQFFDMALDGGGIVHYANGVPWCRVNSWQFLMEQAKVAKLWHRFAVEVANEKPIKLYASVELMRWYAKLWAFKMLRLFGRWIPMIKRRYGVGFAGMDRVGRFVNNITLAKDQLQRGL